MRGIWEVAEPEPDAALSKRVLPLWKINNMDDQEIENLKRYFIEHQTEEKDDQDREHLSRYFEKHPYEGGAWVAGHHADCWLFRNFRAQQ